MLVIVFAMQIKYIDEMRKSGRTIKEDCSTADARYQRGVVYAFAIYVLIVGLAGIVLVSTVPSTKADIATLIKNNSETLLKRKRGRK